MLVGPNIISTFEFFSLILFYVAAQAGFHKKRLETVMLDFIDQSYLGIYSTYSKEFFEPYLQHVFWLKRESKTTISIKKEK